MINALKYVQASGKVLLYLKKNTIYSITANHFLFCVCVHMQKNDFSMHWLLAYLDIGWILHFHDILIVGALKFKLISDLTFIFLTIVIRLIFSLQYTLNFTSSYKNNSMICT